MSSLITASDLRGFPLFAQLTNAQADRLLAGQIGLDVAAEQLLLLQQDEGEDLVLLQSGLAKVRAYMANGEAAVMAVLGPGDLMGEMAVLTAGVRNADVVALTPLKVVKLRAGANRELLLNDGSISLALARLLASRLTALNRRFLLRGGDATTRLLAVLLDLALSCSRGQDPLALIPPLPQRELAAMAGLSQETTSRAFTQRRERGMVIGDPQGMRIVDLQCLRKRGLLA